MFTKMFFAAAVVTTVMIGLQAKALPTSGAKGAKAPVASIATIEVSKKAQTAIAVNFPGATQLQWKMDQPSSYTAYFTQTDGRKVANVDKNGDVISVMTYYNEGSVPSAVRSLLEDKFPGKTIHGVTGIELNDGDNAGVYYQATMQDASHWYFISVNGDDTRITQVLDK